jgi:hypothetical protein
VVDEQLAAFVDSADDARLRALVSETRWPVASTPTPDATPTPWPVTGRTW